MKILDKYIIKQFISTFIFALIAFISLFVIIDLMENLDDFVDAKMQFTLILKYYMYFVPEIIKLMTPVAVLLSSLFTTGKLSNLNELVAIRSSGVSLYRYMMPFLVVTIFITMGSVYFTGYVIPNADKKKTYIEKKYMDSGNTLSEDNIFFQDTKKRIVTISFFEVESKTGYKVSMHEFDAKDITKLVKRTDVEKIVYDATRKGWNFIGVKERTVENDQITTSTYPEVFVNYLNFTPEEIVKKNKKYEEMTNPEILTRISEEKQAGLDPRRSITEYHSRLAFCFASLIVVFFGVPLSANKRKGGMAVQFGVNVLVAFVYMAFMKISQAFGKNGSINPILTAWFSNGVFLLAATINIFRVRK